MGRDFLKENITWQVIDGKNVSIWNDRWILGLDGKKLGHSGLLDSQILEKVV